MDISTKQYAERSRETLGDLEEKLYNPLFSFNQEILNCRCG